mgnify:FL=1
MAKIVRCTNRHFYDAEKFEECPYCNKAADSRIEIQRWTTQHGSRFAGHPTDSDMEVTQPLRPEGSHDQNIVLGGSESVSSKSAEGLDADGDPVTVGIFRNQHQGNDLITGWLVCVEGANRGRDYRIKHGNNWIGRSHNSDIWMDADAEIAYEKHCAVVYDGKSNTFFITPGSGAITYVNGKMLSAPQKLATGDSVRIGKSEFEFIPFCREGHVWN